MSSAATVTPARPKSSTNTKVTSAVPPINYANIARKMKYKYPHNQTYKCNVISNNECCQFHYLSRPGVVSKTTPVESTSTTDYEHDYEIIEDPVYTKQN